MKRSYTIIIAVLLPLTMSTGCGVDGYFHLRGSGSTTMVDNDTPHDQRQLSPLVDNSTVLPSSASETGEPSMAPSADLSSLASPSASPSTVPSLTSLSPSMSSSGMPSAAPTQIQSTEPSSNPSSSVSSSPTTIPTEQPSTAPSFSGCPDPDQHLIETTISCDPGYDVFPVNLELQYGVEYEFLLLERNGPEESTYYGLLMGDGPLSTNDFSNDVGGDRTKEGQQPQSVSFVYTPESESDTVFTPYASGASVCFDGADVFDAAICVRANRFPVRTSRSSAVGGDNGSPFNDQPFLSREFQFSSDVRVTRVEIRAGSWIDRITLHYEDSEGNTFINHVGGSNGGNLKSLDLVEGETVLEVEACATWQNLGFLVSRVRITTSNNRSITNGSIQTNIPFVTGTEVCVTYTATNGRSIVGWHGRDGLYIDQLGVVSLEPDGDTSQYDAIITPTL